MPMTNCFFACIEQEERRERDATANIDSIISDIEIGVFTVSVNYISRKCIDIFPNSYDFVQKIVRKM